MVIPADFRPFAARNDPMKNGDLVDFLGMVQIQANLVKIREDRSCHSRRCLSLNDPDKVLWVKVQCDVLLDYYFGGWPD